MLSDAVLLIGFGLTILVVDLLEASAVIDWTTHNVLLLLAVCLCGWLIRHVVQHDPPRSLRYTILVVMVGICLLLLIMWIEGLAGIQQIEAFQQTHWLRLGLRQSITIAWAISPFLLAFLAMRSSAIRDRRMEQRVADRTHELSAANQRLREEIWRRAQLENELALAVRDLKQLAEQRSEQLEAVQVHVERHERLRALGQMASGIAHELNNKMVPIVSYAELVRREAGLDDTQSERMDAILQCARDAAKVIENLQSFHGDQAGDDRMPVSLPRLAEQVKYLTRPFWKDAAEADGRKITFAIDAADVPTVAANPVQLRQVLTNLVLNAVDSIRDSGAIRVQLDSNRDTVSFSVSDNGQGMTVEEAKRCFEPFFTTKKHGKGLGLSVCHGIVQAHGGTLEVESVLGAGTHFRVTLPRSISPTVDESDGADAPHRALPFSLLLVDDNDAVRHSTKKVLEMLGAAVTDASSASEALQFVRATEFDAVVTDLGMPEMDGCQLVEQLRQEKFKVPVVLMSGWPAARIHQRTEKSASAKPEAIVKKPATIEELVDAVHEVITNARQGRLQEAR